ncbi:putative Prolyl oligopeptidase [Seiridium cardinale]
MVVVPKLTPEVLISAPRRGPAVPNYDGTLAFLSQSTHEISGKTLREFLIMSIETGKTEQLIADEKARDVVWLGQGTNTVLYLSQGEGGYTWIRTVDAGNPSAEPCVVDFIEAPVSSLKVKALKDGSIAFVVVGLADENGNLYNEESDKKPHTARVTDSWNPRIVSRYLSFITSRDLTAYVFTQWNEYTKPQKTVLWYTNLIQEDGEWKLNKPLKNTLSGTTLTAPAGPLGSRGSTDDFDISDEGIIFAAAEHDVSDPMKVGLCNIYQLSLSSFSEASTGGPRRISLQVDVDPQTGTDQGYCTQPRFNPSGSMIAFLRAPYERAYIKSIWVKHAESPNAINVFTMVTGKEWDLLPENFEFSTDGHAIYILAEDSGRRGLFKLDLLPNAQPRLISHLGSVSAVYHLQQDKDSTEKLLLTSSSFVESWIYQVIDVSLTADSEPWVISKASQYTNFGLSPNQISEIYFEGAGDYVVQAWVITPRDFEPSKKKYPLCLHVHSGPNSSWDDEWSWESHPAVWAEQGYIVVRPNITGSLGFGLAMAEAIKDNWGGRPYDDLVNCLEHIKDMPGIDMENAVAAGASYGGYMMYWIQGHELGRRFKTIVCHDGIFHLPTFMLQTDALPLLSADFGGPPFIWNNFDGLERYNPARPDLLKNWKTPMLIIHSDKDYRCPITGGIAAFHTLKALGTPARLLTFPDESHFIQREENLLEWYRQIIAWINKWSGVASRNGNC